MPCTERTAPPDDTSTVALLYREFGRVLVPLEDVRQAYFRNRNAATFRRALREGDIPLPVVSLDDSAKSPRYICLYQLAVLIEHRAKASANTGHVISDDARQLRRQLIDAVPSTEFPIATSARE